MHEEIRTDYCLVSRDLIENRLVSVKAKGVYAVLCCWRQDFNCSAENLADELGIGKESASRLIKELEEFGYVERERIRGPDGRSRTAYKVFPKSTL